MLRFFSTSVQCMVHISLSMICGNGHGYMPIVIEGVSEETFNNWVKAKKATVGSLAPSQHFASAQ